MNINNLHNENNPLEDLISDEIYNTLYEHGLMNHKSVRDYHIKRTFKKLRATKLSACDAIDRIRSKYPYLQFDTIRKIVYQSQQ